MTPLASSINDKKLKNKTTDESLYFISIQGSYNHVEISLFDNHTVLESIVKGDVKASSHLVPYLDALLHNHQIKLNDLSFIAIDQGPGAFTSLRVSIATINGIAFAHKIPLIGIDGLDALCQEEINKTDAQFLVCLLNAFNNDVYFSINKREDSETTTSLERGCKKIDTLLAELTNNPQHITFTGNGAVLHRDLILNTLGNRAIIAQSPRNVCSSSIIGTMALKLWNETEDPETFPGNITPNYIKTQAFAIKK